MEKKYKIKNQTKWWWNAAASYMYIVHIHYTVYSHRNAKRETMRYCKPMDSQKYILQTSIWLFRQHEIHSGNGLDKKYEIIMYACTSPFFKREEISTNAIN